MRQRTFRRTSSAGGQRAITRTGWLMLRLRSAQHHAQSHDNRGTAGSDSPRGNSRDLLRRAKALLGLRSSRTRLTFGKARARMRRKRCVNRSDCRDDLPWYPVAMTPSYRSSSSLSW
jgi:hypothetical protein